MMTYNSAFSRQRAKRSLLLSILASILITLLALACSTKSSAAQTSASSATQVIFEPLSEYSVNTEISLTVRLLTHDQQPVANAGLVILVNGEVERRARTDLTGMAIFRLPGPFAVGTHQLQVVYKGSRYYQASEVSMPLVITPIQAEIHVIPPLAGVRVLVDAQEYQSDANGIIKLQIMKAGYYHLQLLTVDEEHEAYHIKFERWRGENFDPHLKAYLPPKEPLQVGFALSYRVHQRFFDTKGAVVDPKRVESFTFQSSHGALMTFESNEPRWFEANRIMQRQSGLEVVPIQYSLQNVMLDRSNVVNRGQQKYFVEGANDEWPINLIFYSAKFAARDALFGFPIGIGIQLEYPDGEKVTHHFNEDGTVELPALPRGLYKVQVADAPGMAPITPVAISRAQDIQLLVISYLDFSLFAMSGLLGALLLLLYGRTQLFSLRRWRPALAGVRMPDLRMGGVPRAALVKGTGQIKIRPATRPGARPIHTPSRRMYFDSQTEILAKDILSEPAHLTSQTSSRYRTILDWLPTYNEISSETSSETLSPSPKEPPRLRHRSGLMRALHRVTLISVVLVALTTPLIKPLYASHHTDTPLWTEGERKPIPLLAYYYIWYDANSWKRAKSDYPLLGHYSSDDKKVMRQHIRWAKEAGIDGFIVSWKSTEKLNQRLAQLIEIAEGEAFKLAIIYQGLDFEREPLSIDKIAADLDLFAQRYATHPSFNLFGRPLVIWSGTWRFSSYEIAQVTATRREQLLILASERNVESYALIAHLVDGNAYYWSSLNPKVDKGYIEKLQAIGQSVHQNQGLWIAPAAPGFDARLVGGTRLVERADGKTLRTELNGALLSAPDAIGLISWNEFSENSHIEPSEQYGTSAIATLAEIAALHGPTMLDFDSSESGDVQSGAEYNPLFQLVEPFGSGRLISFGFMLLLVVLAFSRILRRNLSAKS